MDLTVIFDIHLSLKLIRSQAKGKLEGGTPDLHQSPRRHSRETKSKLCSVSAHKSSCETSPQSEVLGPHISLTWELLRVPS